MQFSIGEFSRMTSLSVKSLRLYHEKGILPPEKVDGFTGYRYYGESDFERAKTVKILKSFDFTLSEIREILDECEDESELVDVLRKKKDEVQEKISRYSEISLAIERIIQKERESIMQETNFEIEEKDLPTILIAGHRMKGKYDEIGKGFSVIARALGRHISGKAMCLYYDHDYKEEDADFEPCFPVRKGADSEGVTVRELKGGKAVTLIHKGPYDSLSGSYKKLLTYIKKKGYSYNIPTREVYLKGPGMILKGNPKNYLTELQAILE